MYYTHPGCRTSILGENRAYCIRDFTVNLKQVSTSATPSTQLCIRPLPWHDSWSLCQDPEEWSTSFLL